MPAAQVSALVRHTGNGRERRAASQ